MKPIYTVRLAKAHDMTAILGLIGQAATWLQTAKNTDQWARPWPDRDARDERVSRGIDDDRTWIVECGGVLAGTITYRDQGNPRLWDESDQSEPAVYVSRLIVARPYAGQRVGSALIDWAGLRGMRDWGARWVRVDVWTTNDALHNYYKNQGFRHMRTYDFDDPWKYPSAALFQKPTADIDRVAANRFKEVGLALAG